MFRLLRRVFTMGFLLSVLFIAVSSGNAFASQRPTHPLKVVKPSALYSMTICTPEESALIDFSASGNSDDCTAAYYPGFDYQLVSPWNNQVTGTWSSGLPSPDIIQSCSIDAWFPYGDLSSGTKAHYDFWYGTYWLGWVGQDINQYSAPAGWNRIATNLQIHTSGQILHVTLHNDGGSGNLAFAAMRFSCN